MIPTPAEVIPLIECAVPSLLKALRKGAAYATNLQPDADTRDPYFWSHSARFKARQILVNEKRKDGWSLLSAQNSAIHLTFNGLQPARVLKSLNGSTPHAGPNRTRQSFWKFEEELNLRSPGGYRPIPVIFDWHMSKEGPVIHAGVPKAAGDFKHGALLHWRIALTGIADDDLRDITFNNVDDSPEAEIILKVDPAEYEEGL